jgi:hypothetical protein
VQGGRGPEYLESVGACPATHTFPPTAQFYERRVEEARTLRGLHIPSFYIALKTRLKPRAKRYLPTARKIHPSFV